MKVLLVEDNLLTASVLVALLRTEGIEAVETSTVREANSALESTPDFDAAIVDVYLPDGDGFSFLREVRSKAQFQSLQMILVSAGHFSQEEHELVDSLPPAKILDKPFEMQELLEILGAEETKGRKGGATDVD